MSPAESGPLAKRRANRAVSLGEIAAKVRAFARHDAYLADLEAPGTPLASIYRDLIALAA